MSAHRLAAAVLGMIATTLVWAQQPPATEGSVEVKPIDALLATFQSSGVSLPNVAVRTDEVVDVAVQTLQSPETLNRVLDTFLTRDHGWQFLRDVNFQFKAFEADGANEAALGFSYDYNKSVQNHPLECSADACIRGLDLMLTANGNVAFDSQRNPNNLIETALSFAFMQSKGGVTQLGQEQSKRLQQLTKDFQRADTEEEEEAAVEQIVDLVGPALSDQFYWEVAGDVSFESDQSFERKQWTYGVHAAFDMKGWSNDSAIARFNIFDYPFAALRMLTGYEECEGGGSACFVPRGTAWPSFLVGLARVSPEDDDPRALAGAASEYDRGRFEASFRTPLARLGNDRLYVSINYRYYKELDASPLVRSLDLDSFSFYTIVLGGSDGIYVSYTDGKLPLDLTEDRVFELGYQFHL